LYLSAKILALNQEAAMRTGALLLVLGAWATAQGAEISVRGGVIRVEKNSQLRMTDDQIDLTRGTITYQVQDPAAQVAILTPSVSVKAYTEGVYRIAVRKTGESEITPQSGRMMVMAAGGEQWLEAGQKMIARGPRVNPQFRIMSAVSWWRQLASLLQNIQIGAGGGVSAGGGGDEDAATAKETRSKPQSENSAVRSGNAHSSEDRPKTSDSHSNVGRGSAHSSDSRPATSSGSGNSGRSSETHAAPAGSSGGSSQSSDKAAKGK